MFLSGGIDSAAIATLMADMLEEPVNTFSVAFREKEANELTYARAVSRSIESKHHEVLVSPEDFFGALPRFRPLRCDVCIFLLTYSPEKS